MVTTLPTPKNKIHEGTPERFDINWVQLRGFIYKIWSRDDGNLYARLELENSEGQSHKEDGKPIRVTIQLPGGRVNGSTTSLMAGDRISINGYLNDTTYLETLEEFLKRSRNLKKLEEIPQLGAIKKITANRHMTCVVPQERTFLDVDDEIIDLQPNSAAIEGLIVRTWKYAEHFYARIACYDRFTDVIEGKSNNNRVRRKPHYVTVLFKDSFVDGRPVFAIGEKDQAKPGGLKKRDRIRVYGRILQKTSRENLRSFLVENKQNGLFQEIYSPEEVGAIAASYILTVIEAQQIVQYT